VAARWSTTDAVQDLPAGGIAFHTRDHIEADQTTACYIGRMGHTKASLPGKASSMSESSRVIDASGRALRACESLPPASAAEALSLALGRLAVAGHADLDRMFELARSLVSEPRVTH
jgi:hypothetical protein